MQKSNKISDKKQKVQDNNPVAQSVAQVFSASRDIDVQNPYHMDGDMEMYNQQNIKLRQQLAKDEDLRRQIDQIVKLYTFDEHGRVNEQNYKKMQRQLAIILRPDIDKQQLDFVVQQDWQYDQKDNFVIKQQLSDKIFEMVDVWSIGVNKQEYISFTRLIKKKLKRAIETPKNDLK